MAGWAMSARCSPPDIADSPRSSASVAHLVASRTRLLLTEGTRTRETEKPEVGVGFLRLWQSEFNSAADKAAEGGRWVRQTCSAIPGPLELRGG